MHQTVVPSAYLQPLVAGGLLCVLACSSPPIPSYEERQPADAIGTVAASSRTSAATLVPTGMASSAARPLPVVAQSEPSSEMGGDAGAGVDGDAGGDAGADDTDVGAGVDGDAGADGAGVDGDAGADAATLDAAVLVGLPDANGLVFEAELADAWAGSPGDTDAAEVETNSTSEDQPELLPFPEFICPPTFFYDQHYAEGNEFWLGDQAERLLGVDGFGYFAAHDAEATPAYRYAQTLALSVRRDGTLEDRAGYAVLGYSAEALADRCLTTLIAPISLPGRVTTRIELRVNLDSEAPLASVPFDSANPATSAIAPPYTLSCVDPDGKSRPLAVYFEHVGVGVFRYHLVAPSHELVPGTTGVALLGSGELQFDAEGALLTESGPEICTAFDGASGYQCLMLEFGRAIFDDGATGLEDTTSFAAPTALSEVTSDGYAAGTGTSLGVDASGTVSVAFDNGQTRAIGVLALARFPNEDELAKINGPAFIQTAGSDAPAFGAPGDPGRGFVKPY